MRPGADTLVIAFTWPTGQMKMEMVLWLVRSGAPVGESHWRTVCKRPHAAAIKEAFDVALLSPFERFVFVENDVFVRGDEGEAFWMLEADFVCMEGGCTTWESAEEFHEGLWRTHRTALAALPRPVVRKNLGVCPGRQIRLAARLAGFSVAHAGRLIHERRSLFR